MTPWAWEEAVEAEAIARPVSLEAGVALEGVKEAERAPEADPAPTETAASQKEEIAEKLSVLLQLNQLCPRATWTRGFCPTLDGDRHPYDRTPPGTSIRLPIIDSKDTEETKGSTAAEAPDGEQEHRQLPLRPPEVSS